MHYCVRLLLQLLVIYGINVSVFATVNIDCQKSTYPICNGDNVDITCLTETSNEELLRWTREDDSTLVEFNYTSVRGDVRVADNITFTLHKTSSDIFHSDKFLLYSTAQFNNVSKSMGIKCSDGSLYKPCHVRTADVSNPTMTSCSFISHEQVNIAWQEPVTGGECCVDYAVNNTKTTKKNDWFKELSKLKEGKLSYYSKFRSYVTNITNFTLPLTSDTYVVHCRDKNGRMVSTSEEVHIITETGIESLFIEPAYMDETANMVEYNVTVKIQETERIQNRIDCVPPEKDTVVSCITQSMSQPVNRTTDKTSGVATCRVPLNETCNFTVTLMNKANRVTTRSASFDILARLYEAILSVNETCEREKANAVQRWQSCIATLNDTQAKLNHSSNDLTIGIGIGSGSSVGFVLLLVIVVIVVTVLIKLCVRHRQAVQADS